MLLTGTPSVKEHENCRIVEEDIRLKECEGSPIGMNNDENVRDEVMNVQQTGSSITVDTHSVTTTSDVTTDQTLNT